MSMNIFYVYMYMDQDNCPFYVGKGKGDRYRPSWHTFGHTMTSRKVRKLGVANIKIHFLHKDISEEEAFSWERYWIKYFGRIDNGTGQLTNHTDGGDGISGFKRSEDTKRRISEKLKGHPGAMKGKHHTEEAKRKISKAMEGNQHYKRKAI